MPFPSLTFTKVTELVPFKPVGSESPKGSSSKRLHPLKASADQPSIATGPNSVWTSWTTFPSTTIEASGASVTGLGQHGDFTGPQVVPTSFGKGDYGDATITADSKTLDKLLTSVAGVSMFTKPFYTLRKVN